MMVVEKIMDISEPVQEMLHVLEALDKQQAILQVHSYIAYRYSCWCGELFAELGSRRAQLEQIVHDWQEADQSMHH
jgi:hypothetical protein